MDNFLHALGYHPGAPLEQLKRVFTNVVLPRIQNGLKNEDAASDALFSELLGYEYLVKATETEEGFREAYAQMGAYLTSIGQRAAEARVWTEVTPAPVVGFWLPGSSILAHTEQLITLLKGIREMEVARGALIKPVIYIGAQTNNETKKVFDAIGWPVRFLGDWGQALPLPPLQLLGKLREAVTADNCQALVFVSTPVHILTAVAMQVAPVHIWWSMKWHALDVPGLDERMTPRRGTAVEMGGYTWRCGHVALPRLVDPERQAGRERLRNRYKIGADQVVYGFFGREDKLTLEYGEAICTLLEANPQGVFVYTGRRRIPAFEEKLKTVANRCRFIGWVDVASTIWAIDVYADSFPMGSGHTAFAAMQAGIPVVTLMTEINKENSAASHVHQICSGDGVSEAEAAYARALLTDGDLSFDPGVATIADWHYRLCELGQSAEWRVRLGAHQKVFVEQMLMDTQRYAEQTSTVILETIARKRGILVESITAQPRPPVPDAPPEIIYDGEATETTARADSSDATGAEPGTAAEVAGGRLAEGQEIPNA